MSQGSNLPWDGFWKGFSGVLCTLAAVPCFTLATTLLGIRFSRPLAWGIVLSSLLFGWGIARLASSVERRSRGREPNGDPANRAQDSPASSAALPLLAGAIYLFLWFAAATAPELSWDGNAYHLPTINAWLREGRVHWIDPRQPHAHLMNGYPKGAELTAMVAVRVLEDGELANCMSLLFLPLGFLGLACLAQVAGARPSLALLCGSLFVLAPLNIHQSVTTYVDSAYACAVTAFGAALGLTLHRLRARRVIPWHCVPLLGCAGGLALGIRPTAILPILGGFLCLAAVLYWRSHRFSDPSRHPAAGAAFLTLVFLWILAIGGYWYARNLRHEANPLYPVRVALLGQTLLEGRGMEEIGVKGHLPQFMRPWSHARRVLYTWAQGGTKWPDSMRGPDNRIGGLGFLWPVACLPAIALVAAGAARSAAQRALHFPFLACAGVIIATFVATPENWWPRYHLWVYALGLPCFAMVAQDQLRTRARWSLGKLWIVLCVVLAAGEGLLATAQVFSKSYPGPRPMRVKEVFESENWRWPDNFLFPGMRGSLLDRILSGPQGVAFGPSPDPGCRVRNRMVGQLAQPVGTRDIVPIPPAPAPADLRELAARGTRYIIWDEGNASSPCHPPEALLEAGEGWQRREGFWMARLKPQEVIR